MATLNRTAQGDSGDNTIYGTSGADSFAGNAGNDSIYGGDGGDFLNGNTGDDLIFGGNGNDTLNGGRDNDALFGDNGNGRSPVASATMLSMAAQAWISFRAEPGSTLSCSTVRRWTPSTG